MAFLWIVGYYVVTVVGKLDGFRFPRNGLQTFEQLLRNIMSINTFSADNGYSVICEETMLRFAILLFGRIKMLHYIGRSNILLLGNNCPITLHIETCRIDVVKYTHIGKSFGKTELTYEKYLETEINELLNECKEKWFMNKRKFNIL